MVTILSNTGYNAGGEYMGISINDKLNEALALHQKGDLIGAEFLYKEVLSENSNDINALNLLGVLKTKIKEFDEAIIYLKRVSEIDSEFFDAWFNLALAYKKNNCFEEAIKAYQKAIALKPDNSFAYYNLAAVYELKNETDTAIEYYKKALEYNKEISEEEISYLLGCCYLKVKDFERGWFYYERRLSKEFAIYTQQQAFGEKYFTKPHWDGNDIKDKTIFVYYEAGLGDTILFFRYLLKLKDICKKVLFKPQATFVELLKSNNTGLEIIDSKVKLEELDYDVHAPIMSLPFLLKNYSEKAPFSEGYFTADKEKSNRYKEKYFNNEKLKIGIKWAGNKAYDLSRIINLESFFKLFDMKGIQFYSLQKGDGEEDIAKIPSEYSLICLGETFNNFADTAAAIDNLDLIICNDTSIAHLAGAMGKSCWILLPFVQNWRWNKDLSSCAWYESVKLFKQKEVDNWDEVFDRVKKELTYFMSMQSP